MLPSACEQIRDYYSIESIKDSMFEVGIRLRVQVPVAGCGFGFGTSLRERGEELPIACVLLPHLDPNPICLESPKPKAPRIRLIPPRLLLQPAKPSRLQPLIT